MAKCSVCQSTILFGGVTDGEFRFCNAECQGNGLALLASRNIPEDVLTKVTNDIHQGACPVCKGDGPVDVHTHHFIWSVLILTSWHSRPTISCRPCGVKKQIGYTFGSAVAGWWGFPWGILLTPIQIVRNIVSLCSPPDTTRPSDQLRKIVAINMATHLLEQQKAASSAPPPLPS